MNDSGLYHICRAILDAKTQGDAETYIDESVGNKYLAFAKELLSRVTYHRTVDQNSLYYKWIAEIARQTHDSDIDVRRYCKFTFGLPILFEEDMHKQRDLLRKYFANATHAEKLAMMDMFNVSSLMTTKQFKRYLDQIALHYRAQGTQVDRS